MPPPTRPRAGSSAAAGTRSAGASAASRPPPISTPSVRRPAGLAGAGRRPCRLGEQRGDARGRDHRRDPGARRRPDRARPAASRRGIFVDAADGAGRARACRRRSPCSATARSARAQEILLLQRPHRRRRHGHQRRGLAGDAPRRRRRPAQRPHHRPTPPASTRCSPIAGTRPTPWLYDGRLRMVGVKLYLDGALGSRGAWLKQPYRDAPGQRGLGFLTDDASCKNMMSRGRDGRLPGRGPRDRRRRQRRSCSSAIEELADTYTGDRRWRIEHAQIVDPADLPRFGRNGIIASMQPVHQTSDMADGRGADGARRGCGGAYAWRSMLDNRRAARLRLRLPGREPQPLPRPRRRDQPRGCAAASPPGGWLPAAAR